jgi:hypothetical protein
MAIQWDATWNQARRHTVEGALERIVRMLTRAYLSIRAAQRDQEARTAYITHFNNASMTNLGHVTSVIRLMHDRMTVAAQILTMSYVPNLGVFNALGVGPLPAGVVFNNVEAFVIPPPVPPPPATPVTMYIAPAFFTGDVYIPNAQNQRTGTGTILHELSHAVGKTDDCAYSWDAAYRRISANERSRNADSYRQYCQSFDT